MDDGRTEMGPDEALPSTLKGGHCNGGGGAAPSLGVPPHPPVAKATSPQVSCPALSCCHLPLLERAWWPQDNWPRDDGGIIGAFRIAEEHGQTSVCDELVARV